MSTRGEDSFPREDGFPEGGGRHVTSRFSYRRHEAPKEKTFGPGEVRMFDGGVWGFSPPPPEGEGDLGGVRTPLPLFLFYIQLIFPGPPISGHRACLNALH